MIIGITGRLEAGKSTFARYLVDALRIPGKATPRIVPFSKPVKSFALRLGWNGKKDEKGRRLLQLLGTEVGRDCISKDIWANRWNEAVRCWHEASGIIIADDVRYNNEAERIQAMGGVIFEIIKPRPAPELPPAFPHASEMGIAAKFVSDVIVNDGDFEQLRKRAIFIAGVCRDMEARQ